MRKLRYFCSSSWFCSQGLGVLESSGRPTVLNNTRSRTVDRLSSSSDTRRVRVSNTSTCPAALWGGRAGDKQVSTQNCFEFSIIHECVVFVMQPDGAESVASLYSSDTASDKRAASHHTHNSGPPTISVSRASESSGTDRHLRLHFVLCDFIKQLLPSLTKTADVFVGSVLRHR